MSYEDEEVEDRRQERRWNIPIPVFVKGVRNDGKEFNEETITADASPSGMCVLLTVELRKGDQVTVTAPEEKFESTAIVAHVSTLGPNMNRARVNFPDATRFSREAAAKKYVYDYQWGNWIGYMLDGIYYNTKYEPFGRVGEFRIFAMDSDETLFVLRVGCAFDIHSKCMGHII